MKDGENRSEVLPPLPSCRQPREGSLDSWRPRQCSTALECYSPLGMCSSDVGVVSVLLAALALRIQRDAVAMVVAIAVALVVACRSS